LLEVKLRCSECSSDHRLVLHFVQHVGNLFQLLILLDMRKKKCERIECWDGNDDRIRRHRLTALIAKFCCFAFWDDIADTRVRAYRNSNGKRVRDGLHSSIKERPVCHFDRLRCPERATVEPQDRACKGL
jgi:hypothetical protein